MARLAVLALACLCAACATVAQITSAGEPACRAALEHGFTAILRGQGESAEVAGRLSGSAAAMLAQGIAPRPFLVASPSGADYSFFVQRLDGTCALRLYARQKGFVSYANNLTYIATETLGPCRCAE